ncbi:MAG: sulfate adenylyltransferase subunit CysN [Bryobacteraceae bacterium]
MAESQLLRFFTAGSVDDGKSTLIGRLLYEAKAVYEDQLASVERSGLNRSTGPLDFSLLTDGLRAEREQGITIDVAYRYFNTPRRKYIIADTPGHEQYTRNMATGASTADLAIILIDARKGVLPQSRRHGYISSLLGIRYAAVAVNKMDLMDFREDVFKRICAEFGEFARRAGLRNVVYFPISALEGDNIVTRSERTPWYKGVPLLEYLETVPLEDERNFTDLRLPIQCVIRPTLDFRGYAGTLASGVLRPGDRVMSLASGQTTTVKSLPTFDGELDEAFPPMSVTVCLEDEIDLSRGDMLVSPDNRPEIAQRFRAMVVWMHQTPGALGRSYLIKQNARTVTCQLTRIEHRVDVNTLHGLEATQLGLNDIASVVVTTHRPIYFDPYHKHRTTGAFILIDPLTNSTLAAGMIEHAVDESAHLEPVTEDARRSRLGHAPATVWLAARTDMARRLERILFDRGCHVYLTAGEPEGELLPEIAKAMNRAGLIVICALAEENDELQERTAAATGGAFISGESAERIVEQLVELGYLPA